MKTWAIRHKESGAELWRTSEMADDANRTDVFWAYAEHAEIESWRPLMKDLLHNGWEAVEIRQ